MPVMEIAIFPASEADPRELFDQVHARCVAVVERCGLPYHVSERILVQGSIGELFALAERMHGAAREADGTPRVRTEIHIEDGGAVERLLDGRIEILQAAV
jgi:uncharacterized protein YqgV (UPF0045/DUF77 family)